MEQRRGGGAHPFFVLACTSMSLSAKSMTLKAFRTVRQSHLSLMEGTLAQRPYWGREECHEALLERQWLVSDPKVTPASVNTAGERSPPWSEERY